jgi:hypothetical protein
MRSSGRIVPSEIDPIGYRRSWWRAIFFVSFFRVLGGAPWITLVRRGVNEESGLLTLKSEHQEAGAGDAAGPCLVRCKSAGERAAPGVMQRAQEVA